MPTFTGVYEGFIKAYKFITDSFTVSYNHGAQRENDYRSATIVSGLTGYTAITATLNYEWTQGGNVYQTIAIRDSGGNSIVSATGSGQSGSVTISTALNSSETYSIFIDAVSALGATFAILTAYGTVTYETTRRV